MGLGDRAQASPDPLALRRPPQLADALGGLIGDMNNYIPDFDPVRAAAKYIDYWGVVYVHTGMTYPVDITGCIRRPSSPDRRSRPPSSSRTKPARACCAGFAKSIFVFGRPADTSAAHPRRRRAGSKALDIDRFRADFAGDVVGQGLPGGLGGDAASQRLRDEARGRPSGHREGEEHGGTLAVRVPDGDLPRPNGKRGPSRVVPVDEYLQAMEDVSPGSTDTPRRNPTPDDFFARWPTASPRNSRFYAARTQNLRTMSWFTTGAAATST